MKSSSQAGIGKGYLSRGMPGTPWRTGAQNVHSGLEIAMSGSRTCSQVCENIDPRLPTGVTAERTEETEIISNIAMVVLFGKSHHHISILVKNLTSQALLGIRAFERPRLR